MTQALRLAMLSLLLCAPARAYEVETGAILICDTQKQVERFVELFDGKPEVTISAINAEQHNPTACAMANVAFVRGGEIGTARTMSYAFRIEEILVVALNTPAGMRPVAPATFFTPVKIQEFAV
jgi:hypothetical protein